MILRNPMRILFFLVAIGVFVSSGFAGTVKTVSEIAVSRIMPPGGPRYSDVCFSTRSQHPSGKNDPYDSLEAAQAFHATRIDWCYSTNSAFIAALKKLGYRYFGTMNNRADWLHGQHPETVSMVDLNGTPIIPPWMRSWQNMITGCMNNPEYRRGYLEMARSYITAGADGLQRDDQDGNQAAVAWGGCFCGYCMEGFRAFLERRLTSKDRMELGIRDSKTFNYRDFLREKGAPAGDAFAKWNGGKLKELFKEFQAQSTASFHRWAREEINRFAGRPIPWSCNNTDLGWGSPRDLFDFGMAELTSRQADPVYLWQKLNATRLAGKAQALNMPKFGPNIPAAEMVLVTRRTIATSYALGSWMVVPWDVYFDGGLPRYFGKPEDYADLYGFVRGIAPWLNRYEDAAVSGEKITDPRYPEKVPLTVQGNSQLYAFIRAIPENTKAPVVIHLVDWSPQPKTAEILLIPSRFFTSSKVKIQLLSPVSYEYNRHEEAERDPVMFSRLVKSVDLDAVTIGGTTTVKIPPLNPWGILLIRAEP